MTLTQQKISRNYRLKKGIEKPRKKKESLLKTTKLFTEYLVDEKFIDTDGNLINDKGIVKGDENLKTRGQEVFEKLQDIRERSWKNYTQEEKKTKRYKDEDLAKRWEKEGAIWQNRNIPITTVLNNIIQNFKYEDEDSEDEDSEESAIETDSTEDSDFENSDQDDDEDDEDDEDWTEGINSLLLTKLVGKNWRDTLKSAQSKSEIEALQEKDEDIDEIKATKHLDWAYINYLRNENDTNKEKYKKAQRKYALKVYGFNRAQLDELLTVSEDITPQQLKRTLDSKDLDKELQETETGGGRGTLTVKKIVSYKETIGGIFAQSDKALNVLNKFQEVLEKLFAARTNIVQNFYVKIIDGPDNLGESLNWKKAKQNITNYQSSKRTAMGELGLENEFESFVKVLEEENTKKISEAQDKLFQAVSQTEQWAASASSSQKKIPAEYEDYYEEIVRWQNTCEKSFDVGQKIDDLIKGRGTLERYKKLLSIQDESFDETTMSPRTNDDKLQPNLIVRVKIGNETSLGVVVSKGGEDQWNVEVPSKTRVEYELIETELKPIRLVDIVAIERIEEDEFAKNVRTLYETTAEDLPSLEWEDEEPNAEWSNKFVRYRYGKEGGVKTYKYGVVHNVYGKGEKVKEIEIVARIPKDALPELGNIVRFEGDGDKDHVIKQVPNEGTVYEVTTIDETDTKKIDGDQITFKYYIEDEDDSEYRKKFIVVDNNIEIQVQKEQVYEEEDEEDESDEGEEEDEEDEVDEVDEVDEKVERLKEYAKLTLQKDNKMNGETYVPIAEDTTIKTFEFPQWVKKSSGEIGLAWKTYYNIDDTNGDDANGDDSDQEGLVYTYFYTADTGEDIFEIEVNYEEEGEVEEEEEEEEGEEEGENAKKVKKKKGKVRIKIERTKLLKLKQDFTIYQEGKGRERDEIEASFLDVFSMENLYMLWFFLYHIDTKLDVPKYKEDDDEEEEDNDE